MFGIATEEDKCTGCRACEIACSYHHRKVFNPRISSIEISKHGKEEIISITVHRGLPSEGNGHLSCNQCVGENEPLCVKYCAVDAIQVTSASNKGGE